MKIDSLEIDDRLKEVLFEQGILELYPPQTETIKKGLLSGKNFVLAVPTASGKTLVALLAIFNSLLKKKGSKAVYLAPLRALASEKYEEIKQFSQAVGLKTAISTGDLDDSSRWLGGSDIIIATNEKFDSLIRHGVNWLNDISIIISDEVHLINDSSRGPVLEVVMTLIKRNLPDCQIIALSATIINAYEIAEWLEAELVLSSWRPVELKEGVWQGGRVHYGDGTKINLGRETDRDGYVFLANDIVEQGGQALVFANTRKSAETSAESVGKKLRKTLNDETISSLIAIANTIRSTGEKTQMRDRLANIIETGAAFHHAGLISRHRKIVEDNFKNRLIRVIASTPSLAAGVNLPGRRVIIRSLSRYSAAFGGNTYIPVLEYKQMAGRAGRPRYDPYGEALIIAKSSDEVYNILDNYVRAETEEIFSKLGSEPALRSHILAFIAADYVDDFDSVLEMISGTFYGYQNEDSLYLVEGEVEKALYILKEAKLISREEPYLITPFGRRTNELYVDPLSARMIKLGLEGHAEKEHIPNIAYLQLITSTPDLRSYSLRQREVSKLVDISEKYAEHWMDDNDDVMSEVGFEIFLTSLKMAYALDLWLDEKSEEDIALALNIASGDLHNLINTAVWLVHCSHEFSKIFKWKNHQKRLRDILDRLKYGIRVELLSLVRIRGIGRVRARVLHDAGFKTIDEIIETPESVIAKLPQFGEQLAKNLKEALQTGEEFKSETTLRENIKEAIDQTSLETFFD